MPKRPPMDLKSNLDLSALQSRAVEQPDPVIEAEKARKPAVVQLAPRPYSAKANALPRSSTEAEQRQKGRAGKVSVQTWIELEKRRRLKVLAAQTDVTIEEYLAKAIDKILDENKA